MNMPPLSFKRAVSRCKKTLKPAPSGLDGVQCICKICICGKHHCPKHPKPQPFLGKSLAHTDYPGYTKEVPKPVDPDNEFNPELDDAQGDESGAPRRPVPGRKPDNVIIPPSPFEGLNTYKHDYPGYKPQIIHPIKPSDNLRNSGEFYGNTTSNDDYRPTSARPPAPFKPKPAPYGVVPFEGNSMHRVDYPGYCVTPPIRHVPEPYRPSTAKFDGRTTASVTFVPHPIEPKKPDTPMRFETPLPFEGDSTARRDYPGAKPQPVPKKVPDPYRPSTAKFDGRTTANVAFVPHPIEPKKPDTPMRFETPLPFEGDSTTRRDYPGAKPQPIPRKLPDSYRPSTAKFDGRTTSTDAYIPHEIPEKRVKTPIQPSPPLPFTGKSSYTINYNGDSVPVQIRKPSYRVVTPHPFEGTSTVGEAYKPFAVEPKVPKPRDEWKRELDERDFGTEHRNTYTPKETVVCPATLLPPPPTPNAVPRSWKHEHVWYDIPKDVWHDFATGSTPRVPSRGVSASSKRPQTGISRSGSTRPQSRRWR